MKLRTKKELMNQHGTGILLYGDTGVGKTVTTIQTSPEPILYLMIEPRNIQTSLLAAKRPNVDIVIANYENWDDLMEFSANSDNFKRYKTIVLDSITHLMTANLSFEIMDEGFEALDDSKKNKKKIIFKSKMSKEGYGSLSNEMSRLSNLLISFSQDNKIVVFLARSQDNPKFDRDLSVAPALKGKEYLLSMPGFFDFIGYVYPKIKNGKVLFPPCVSFVSDGSFMGKWTGKIPEKGIHGRPLNIENILRMSGIL